jgi:hypothetical protein
MTEAKGALEQLCMNPFDVLRGALAHETRTVQETCLVLRGAHIGMQKVYSDITHGTAKGQIGGAHWNCEDVIGIAGALLKAGVNSTQYEQNTFALIAADIAHLLLLSHIGSSCVCAWNTFAEAVQTVLWAYENVYPLVQLPDSVLRTLIAQTKRLIQSGREITGSRDRIILLLRLLRYPRWPKDRSARLKLMHLDIKHSMQALRKAAEVDSQPYYNADSDEDEEIERVAEVVWRMCSCYGHCDAADLDYLMKNKQLDMSSLQVVCKSTYKLKI